MGIILREPTVAVYSLLSTQNNNEMGGGERTENTDI